LELRNVTSGYADTVVLRDISLSVDPSSIVALLGPNGAGKTTLLRAAAGLNRVRTGEVYLGGHDVTRKGPSLRTSAGLCLIPEGRAIFRSLTVRENLLLQAGKRDRVKAVDEAVDLFPLLAPRLEQMAGSLSGGEQQMLALVRACTSNPRIVLVDEASLGLAPMVVDVVFDFLTRLARDGAALLIVDQYVTRALDLADRAYVLVSGKIVYSGKAQDLKASDIFTKYFGA
jgi:branched-chain amino acid transport system ATP-binding protein